MHPKLAFPGTKAWVSGGMCLTPLRRGWASVQVVPDLFSSAFSLPSKRGGWDLQCHLFLWLHAGPGSHLACSPTRGLEVRAPQQKGGITSGSLGKDRVLLQQLLSLTVVGAVVLMPSQ